MHRRAPREIQLVAECLVFAIIYALTARLGALLTTVSGCAALISPPAAVALFALVKRGSHLWPGVALGVVASSIGDLTPWWLVCLIAAGNTLEALAGAWAARHAARNHRLTRVSSLARLLVFVALGSTMISACLSTLGFWLAGEISTRQVPSAWLGWWLGHVTSIIVLSPVLFAWATRAEPMRVTTTSRTDLITSTAMLVGFAVCLFGVFAAPGARQPALTQPLVIVPFLLWASMRFGVRGATTATLFATFVAVWGTATGHGPFVHARMESSLLYLQVFVSIVAITALIFSAALLERDRALAQSETATHARDEFLSVASHELRTPLTSLGLSVQMLLAQEQVTRESATRLLGVIQRQVLTLTRLVGELTDSTALDGRAVPLHREDVDLAELARAAAATAESPTAHVDVHASGTIEGYWDRARIEQVLGHLLANAVKFGAGRPIELTIERESETVARIVVRDHGIGIPDDRLHHIFDRFVQAVAKGHYGGLGLGLHTVKALVELHGGTIDVESDRDTGSTFTVRLPIR